MGLGRRRQSYELLGLPERADLERGQWGAQSLERRWAKIDMPATKETALCCES